MKIRHFIWERLRGPFVSGDGLVEYPATFREELNDQCGRIIFFVALISTFGWLPYISIDRQLYPDEPLIVTLRVGLTIVGLVVLILQGFRRFNQFNLAFLIILSAYIEIATGVITGLTRADPAYLGGYLFVITLMALIPIPRRAAWSILALSLLLFFTVGFTTGMQFDTLRLRYSLNDLMVTVLVVGFFIYLLDKLRFSNWEKSRKISRQNETLRKSEEFSTQLIAAIPDIVVRTNIDGKILYMNEKGLEASQYEKEEIIGQNMLSFVAPEDLEAAVQNTILMMEQPLGPKEYHLILKKTGKSLYEVNGSVLKEKDGTPYGMVYIVRDISERRRAEEALRESEEKLRSIVNTIPHIISIWDMNLSCTYVSPSIQRLLGYTPEEFLDMTLDQLVTPESMEIAMQAYQEDLELERSPDFSGHNVRVLELDLHHKDGCVIPFENTITFLRNVKGAPIGIVIMGTDISERKRAEEALRESEEKYKFLIENTSDIIWIFDLATMSYSFGSNSLERILGYATDEAIGLTLDDIFSTETKEAVQEKFGRIITDGTSSDRILMEAEHIAKNGSRVWMEINAVAKRDELGNIIAFMGATRDISERKRAEAEREAAAEALRRSEEKYRLLTENIDDVIWTIDPEWRYTYISPSIQKLRGFSPEETLGKTVVENMSPESIKAILDEYNLYSPEIQQGGNPIVRIELEQYRKDSSTVWVEASIKTMRDAADRLTGFVGVSRDITERKEAEAALLESEQRLADIIDFLPLATMVIDREGRVTAWNRAMEAITGVNRTDIMGKGNHEYAIPFYGERRPILIDLVFASDEEFTTKYSHVRREGGILSAEAFIPKLGENGIILVGYASPLYGSDGSIIGAIESIRDITDIRRVETELQEAEEKYRTILETMDSGYYEVDLQGNMLFCNPALRKYLGYEEEDIQGLNFGAYMDQEEALRIFKIFNKVYTSGQPSGDFYWRLARPDKQNIYSAASAYPLRNSRGTIVGFRGTVRDITILKEAKDAADAANRSKSAFLANMSHEIRTPMNAILGFAHIMERDPHLSPQSLEHLDIINRSGEHLLALINDILEMSKIEAGRAIFVPNTFDLHALLKDIERMFRIRTDAKNLRFLLDMTGETPRWVITDEKKLRQILINLLGNAVKFTEKGSIALRLCVAAGEGSAMNLQFEVEDTGPGMAEDEIDRLFQAFEQTQSGVKSGGTGLGLALSKGFIQVMGGAISVRSTFGKGTTFRFEVPVREGTGEHVKPKETKQQVLHLKPGQGDIRVLIADDRDTNRQLLSHLLDPVGFVTRSAVNGEEVVREAREWKPQVVLMDMAMPVMDGYEATRIIKASPDLEGTIIVAVTASAFEEDRQRISTAGADGYLSKPFKAEELFETIGRLTGAEYLYKDAGVPEKMLDTVGDSVEMRRFVVSLPADLVSQIRIAVESADMDLLNELTEELVADYPVLAQRTREMATRYEYDALIELFSPGE